jgi:LCP family protein required for cell wall assembly
MDSIRRKPVPTPPVTIPSTHGATTAFLRKTHPPIKSHPRFRTRARRVIRTISLLLFLVLVSLAGYFAWRLSVIGRLVHIASNQNASTKTSALRNIETAATSFFSETPVALAGASDGRINILLLGKAGSHDAGRDLTDTIMLLSINTRTDKVALLSLPRDLYVRIPESGNFAKINALYRIGLNQDRGIETIKSTVETILKQPIQYTLIIDFAGFEKTIDALGGVNIDVARDIFDARYPGPNYSYETFELKKGWHMLDGKTALKYVRERHDDPEGDFGRAKRQQQVMQSVKNKAFSTKTFLDIFTLNRVIDVLGESVQTTIGIEEIKSFVELGKKLDTAHSTNIVIDAWKTDSLLRVSHVMVGSTRMFILLPRVGNYSELQDVAANIFDLDTIKRREEAIAEENVTIAVVNRSSDSKLAVKIEKVLKESFRFKQITIAQNAKHSTEPVQHASLIKDTTLRRKPFSLDEILKKLPEVELSSSSATADNDTPNGNVDLTLIVGDDLIESLGFEEDSSEELRQSEYEISAFPDSETLLP